MPSREDVEQAIREAIPERCQGCFTIPWRTELAAEKVFAGTSDELEAATQELVDDLNKNCMYGQREGYIGAAACRYGVICEF